MDRRIVTAGLAAVLSLSVSVAALAQAPSGSPAASPIPVNPAPADSQPLGTLNTPEAARNNEERIQRTQQGGSPADTTTQRRQGQAASDGRPAQAGQTQGQQAPMQQGQANVQRSPADTQYIQQTMAAGTVTLQAANFAESKAQHPRVQRFAAFERAEQNAMFEVLHGMADPATTASTNTQAAQATAQNAPQNPSQAAATAPVISQEGSALMERMSRAQPGPEFDRDFVQLQLDRHKELLQIQERYLSANSGQPGQRAVAMMARTQIREHIAELESIQKELGR